MTNRILVKRSGNTAAIPEASDLEFGELALNYTDGNLFFKTAANTVSLLASTQIANISGNATVGNLISTGSVTATGNVTAAYFIGDGSQLTGISASGNSISSGNSNVDISGAGADITMSVSGVGNVMVISTDGVTVTGNIVGNGIPTTTVSNVSPANPEQGDVWIDSDSGIQYIYFSDGDSAQWAEMEAALSINLGGNGNVDLSAVAQDITPAANITYDLGTANLRWRDLYLTALDVTGNIVGGNLTPTNALAVIHGGTGATTAANALSNLGAASIGKAIAMTIVFG